MMIKEAGHCDFNDIITFYIPNWLELNKKDRFIIRSQSNNREEKDDFSESWENYGSENDYLLSQPTLNLELTRKRDVYAKEGVFIVSDFVFDVKNNHVISLAIDFSFGDEKDNVYSNMVRYHSKIPVSIN